MTIGRIAHAAGVSIDTMRFYERQGLLAKPRRNVSGYRTYSDEVFDRLRFIQDAKAIGFSLREIKELLSQGVRSTRECGPVTRKAEVKLTAMNEEIRRLQGLRRTLEKMIHDCGGTCSHSSKCRCQGSNHKEQNLWK